MSRTQDVLEQFDSLYSHLPKFEERTKDLIFDMVRARGLSVHSVQSRVKTRDSLKRKCERPDKNYQELADVTDTVAFRIITYFDDDVDKIAQMISETFHVDEVRSVDKRDRKATEFGYTALHHICRYTDERERLPENRNVRGIFWEVQICSVLQHAWNEIEHDIGYKSQTTVPSDIQRRLHRLSGVLELVDSEFREIRNKTENYRKAVELRIESRDSDVSDVELDTISLKSFARQDQAVHEAETLMAKRFNLQRKGELENKSYEVILTGLQILQIKTLQEVRELLAQNSKELPDFLERCIASLQADGTKVTFETIRNGMILSNLVIFLMAQRGREALEAYFAESGSFGKMGPKVAQVYSDAII
jgi:putative GTP pyrophosphokinase